MKIKSELNLEKYGFQHFNGDWYNYEYNFRIFEGIYMDTYDGCYTLTIIDSYDVIFRGLPSEMDNYLRCFFRKEKISIFFK